MAVIKMSTKKFINQQDVIDELKRVIKSDKFNRSDLQSGCSVIMDLMYGPQEIEFQEEIISGEHKHQVFKEHNIKPYVCWDCDDMSIRILSPLGVSEVVNGGHNILPMEELVKIISQ